jgi:hypothetical protein
MTAFSLSGVRPSSCPGFKAGNALTKALLERSEKEKSENFIVKDYQLVNQSLVD